MSDSLFKGIILAVVCLAIFAFIHIIVNHYFKVKRRFRSLLGIWLFSGLLYALMFYFSSPDLFGPLVRRLGELRLSGILYGVCVYGTFVVFYWNLIMFVDRSVSARIMLDIENSPQKKLSLQELKQSYKLADKLLYELDDLKLVGFIRESGGYFSNTRKGRRHAGIIGFLKNFLNLQLK